MISLEDVREIINLYPLDPIDSTFDVDVYDKGELMFCRHGGTKQQVLDLLNELVDKYPDYEVEIIEKQKVKLHYKNKNGNLVASE